MRVYELARELGIESKAVVAAAAALALDVNHANDALTPEEQAALRAHLSPEAAEPEATPDPPGDEAEAGPDVGAPSEPVEATGAEPTGAEPTGAGATGYVLVRKASVNAVQRGETIDAATWAAYPEWARAHFDAQPGAPS